MIYRRATAVLVVELLGINHEQGNLSSIAP